MAQPPGFIDLALPSHVCHLHKSLYGLKQAPHAWYNRLSEFLLSIRFQASKGDTSLFIISLDSAMIYLLVYVDDILLTESNLVVLHRLITLLQSEFKLRYLGSVHFFLGIEVKSTAMGILLSQHKYALDIIQRVGMVACKPVDTPLSASSKLGLVPSILYSDPTWYHQIVGHYNVLPSLDLISIMQSTRYVNFYMPPLRIIGLLLNISCVTSRLHQPMVCTSLKILSYLFMVSQMLIGLAVLTIANP